jgi:hypothetical protein
VRPADDRFAPKSGHRLSAAGCPLCAKSGLMHCSKTAFNHVAGKGYASAIASGINREVRAHGTHHGECFCGAVKVEVSGEPEGMGYCHCQSCRSWSGGPVNAFTLWKPDGVRITTGAEHVGTYQKTPVSQRQYCKKCGGHLMTNHPPLGLVDVFAATLPTLQFRPGPRQLC